MSRETMFQPGLKKYLDEIHKYYEEKIPGYRDSPQFLMLERIVRFCKMNGNPKVWDRKPRPKMRRRRHGDR